MTALTQTVQLPAALVRPPAVVAAQQQKLRGDKKEGQGKKTQQELKFELKEKVSKKVFLKVRKPQGGFFSQEEILKMDDIVQSARRGAQKDHFWFDGVQHPVRKGQYFRVKKYLELKGIKSFKL